MRGRFEYLCSAHLYIYDGDDGADDFFGVKPNQRIIKFGLVRCVVSCDGVNTRSSISRGSNTDDTSCCFAPTLPVRFVDLL